jgi:hypothetical protein
MTFLLLIFWILHPFASSVVGIPTGGTFIPRDISVGIHKTPGCSYHCDTGTLTRGWYESGLKRVYPRGNMAESSKSEKVFCYIVSVKVQFFCLPIGQNRITCRSTKRHVHCVLCRGGNRFTGPQWNIYWPVNNKMGIRMCVNHEVPKFIF